MIFFSRDLSEALVRIEQKLDILLRRQSREMASIEDVKNRVASQTTVIASSVTLMGELSQMLKDAHASGDPAAIQAVIDQIDANTAALAASVAENTPAAPTA